MWSTCTSASHSVNIEYNLELLSRAITQRFTNANCKKCVGNFHFDIDKQFAEFNTFQQYCPTVSGKIKNSYSTEF